MYISWQDFSLPHADGTFFLRPDAILAVYIVDTTEDLPAVNMIAIAEAKYERHRDQVDHETFSESTNTSHANFLWKHCR